MLTNTQINTLADRAGVRRSAVINFLSTLSPKDNQEIALANLALDTRLYNWNVLTQETIREGIAAFYTT